MTPAQEQAASAARRDCIAWNGIGESARKQAEAKADYFRVYCLRANITPSPAIKRAYDAAWRTQWEAR